MAKTLTEAAIQRVRPPATGRKDYADAVVPGLALRVTSNGVKSFSMRTRLHGRQIRVDCGRYGAVSLADARTKARAALAKVEQGEDPRITRAERAPDTYDSVLEEYLTRQVRGRLRTAREVEQKFALHVTPRWGGRRIDAITRRDVIELVDAVADKGAPIAANRVLAMVRKFFNWCLERDILEATPAASVKAPSPETERDRVLSDAEVVTIWNAAGELGYPLGPFVRMLMTTAQRLSEVAHMARADIEGDVWTLPREITKSDRSHEVPLSPLAKAVLRETADTGDLLFPSRRGDRPVSGFSKMKASLDALSGVEDWRLHDLRRTAATTMARLGVPVFVVSRVLNHAEGGVTRIYARASYLEEKRRALNVWSRQLETILGVADENVVALRR